MAQNDILNPEDFEALKFYNKDSKINKKIAAMLRDICARLFRGMNVNLDNFYFAGVEDHFDNAFFIDGKKTLNGKNVIAVSIGLINHMNTVDELAAVIAHECGHYIWNNILGGENSYFQERGADLYTVDLMMNGGFNPMYILSMQNKLFGSVNYQSTTLDIHGNSFLRMEDVRSYLTKITGERGYFPDIKNAPEDEGYLKFKKEIDELSNIEHAENYITNEIYQEFGVLHFDLLPYYNKKETLETKINFLIKLLDKKQINNVYRCNQLADVIKSVFSFETKISDSDITLSQKLFLKYHENAINVNPKLEEKCVSVLTYIQASWNDWTTPRKFGPFQEMEGYMNDLIDNYENPEKSKQIAEKISKLSWVFKYNSLYKAWPRFNIGEKIVGKKLPWVVLKSYGDKNINNIIPELTPNFDPNLVQIKDDVLIAYGREAEIYNQAVKQNRAVLVFETKIRYLDNLILVATGQQSIEQYVDKYHLIYNDISDLLLGKDIGIEEYDLSKEQIMVLKEKIKDSVFFNTYGLNSGRYKTLMESKPSFENLQDLIDITSDSELIKGLINSLIYVADYMSGTRYIKIASMLYTKMYQRLQCWFEVPSSDYEKNLLNAKKDLQFVIAEHAALNNLEMATFELGTSFVWDVIKDSLKNKKRSKVYTYVLKTLGIKQPLTNDELFETIADIKSNFVRTVSLKGATGEYECFIKYNNLFHAMVCDYILRGLKFDIIRLFREYDFDYNLDIISQYIEKNKVFENADFDSQLMIYEYLLKHDLFSEKLANKYKYMKFIVAKLVSEKDVNSPNYKKNVDIVGRILRQKYLVNNKDIELVSEQDKLVEFYAQYWANKLGQDDESERYRISVEPVYFMAKEFSPNISSKFIRVFSEKICAQEKLTRLLYGNTKRAIDGGTIEKFDIFGRGIEGMFTELSKKPVYAKAAIDFISRKYSDDSVNVFLHDLEKNGFNKVNFVLDRFNNQSLQMLHENFWSVDLPIRAVLMSRFLNAYARSAEKKKELIISMYFKPGDKYYNDAVNVVDAVYKNLKDHEKNLILSALLVAGYNDENKGNNVGETIGNGLKMFFQAKGSAFIKFGQLLSYLPQLDSNIRKPLATLRDKADIPSRNELFDMINQTLPMGIKSKISHYGNVVGAGSFYVTIRVVYDGCPCVLSVKRPFANELTKSGMDMISNTIADLIKADAKYKPLQNIVNQAKTSTESELNIENDYQKYVNAVGLYESLSVNTPSGEFKPDVAKWMAYGTSPDGGAYKIMEEAQGQALSADEWTEEEKHDFALAYMTLELTILLSGQKWDTDRHMGQEFFYNKDFRDFVIGVFDTAAQMDKMPSFKDKIMLGDLFFELIKSVKSGKKIGDVLIKKIKAIDEYAEKNNIDTSYIDGVQRGLTALSDIIEYQKEIKDENGNVIQPSKSLTADDMQQVLVGILKSGMISKTVISTVISRIIAAGLFMGTLKNIRGVSKNSEQIEVEYKPKKKVKLIKPVNKSVEEYDEYQLEQAQGKVFGIDKDLVVKKKEDSMVSKFDSARDKLKEAVLSQEILVMDGALGAEFA